MAKRGRPKGTVIEDTAPLLVKWLADTGGMTLDEIAARLEVEYPGKWSYSSRFQVAYAVRRRAIRDLLVSRSGLTIGTAKDPAGGPRKWVVADDHVTIAAGFKHDARYTQTVLSRIADQVESLCIGTTPGSPEEHTLLNLVTSVRYATTSFEVYSRFASGPVTSASTGAT